MTSPLARDVMTTGAVTVEPATPVAAVARMFADRGISAAVVTDAQGTVHGIITESDLIRRLADEDERPAGWLARMFDSPFAKAERYARSHGLTAREVMTTAVLTARPEESAAHVARMMEEHHIRRVPVTENGRLLGVVSRSDLLRALVAQQPGAAGKSSDDQIHRAVLAAMRQVSWADTVHAAVHVENGIVEFYGYSPSATVSRALRVLAENVPGVSGVVDRTRHRLSIDPS